jgi:hypothetical protein
VTFIERTESLTVAEALDEFDREHRFGKAAYKKSWNTVKIFGLKFPFPNPQQRRDVVHLHDLTHILTGYDTSWTGVGEIANWEMASGLPARHWIAWFYVPITFTLGWFIAPGKMRAAFSAGRGRNNLYKLRIDRDQMMKMKVGDLRKLLDAPA